VLIVSTGTQGVAPDTIELKEQKVIKGIAMNATYTTAEAIGTIEPKTAGKSLGQSMISTRPDLSRLVSPAQHRVLEFLLEGLTEPQIAAKLSRSRHTVHDHTKAIYQALNVNNRVQLVLLFSSPARQSA
jgi:DNA-binding NarL/FixJ family response regulator